MYDIFVVIVEVLIVLLVIYVVEVVMGMCVGVTEIFVVWLFYVLFFFLIYGWIFLFESLNYNNFKSIF